MAATHWSSPEKVEQRKLLLIVTNKVRQQVAKWSPIIFVQDMDEVYALPTVTYKQLINNEKSHSIAKVTC